MSKHSPGPWLYLRDYEFMNVVDKERNLIASARMGDQTRIIGSIEREANARLLAAAPELLESLREAIRLLRAISVGTINQDHINRIEFAIAKAEGK